MQKSDEEITRHHADILLAVCLKVHGHQN